MFIIKLTTFAATSSSISCNNIYDELNYADNNMTSWNMLILKTDPDFKIQSNVDSVLIYKSSSFLTLLHKPENVRKAKQLKKIHILLLRWGKIAEVFF